MNESRCCQALLAAGLGAILPFLALPAGPQTVPSRNTARGVHYVGSQACSTCHAAIYKSFGQTGMGRSMVPGHDPSWADLPAPATVYDKDLGQYFEVLRKDGQLYQSQYALDDAGKELFRQTWKMEYAVGAGENGIGFIVQRDRFLFEAPLSYYSQAHRWSFSPGYEIQNRGFTRPSQAGGRAGRSLSGSAIRRVGCGMRELPWSRRAACGGTHCGTEGGNSEHC
jgi:hypothetical protein